MRQQKHKAIQTLNLGFTSHSTKIGYRLDLTSHIMTIDHNSLSLRSHLSYNGLFFYWNH